MTGPAVYIDDLTFSYPGQSSPLLSHLHLEVETGRRFGLFGPNGAGKTTLMSLMTGLLKSNGGEVRLFGQPVKAGGREVKKIFGYVPQDFSFYPELSPAENLEFFGAWLGLPAVQIRRRTGELLDVLHLSDVRNKPVKQFSGGMKRRVNLAIGVMHKPGILFLDEPTVGVDVHARYAMIEYLKQVNAEGTTLIYTSHQLAEAQELCDDVALIDEGKIIVHAPLDQLLAEHRQDGLEGLFLSLTGHAYRD